MPLHLLKLCVGAESVEDLEDWVRERLADAGEHAHTTRMIPKRIGELVDGGSLYWVIKGRVQCRQRILAIRPFTDTGGISRCDIVLDPEIVATAWQPRRAFQGWRYLDPKDTPRDMQGSIAADLPQALRNELAELGLL